MEFNKIKNKLLKYSIIDTTSGCWLWQRSRKKDGYARIYIDKKFYYVHRVSFFISNGHWPAKHIDHLCKTKHCINPNHLEDVPQYVNNIRNSSPSVLAYWADRCVRGHDLLDIKNVFVKRDLSRNCKECRSLANNRNTRYPKKVTPLQEKRHKAWISRRRKYLKWSHLEQNSKNPE